jgi:hypothetical protein
MLPGMQVRHTLQLNSFFALLLILPFLYTATTTIPSFQATTSSPQATNHSSPASSKRGLSAGAISEQQFPTITATQSKIEASQKLLIRKMIQWPLFAQLPLICLALLFAVQRCRLKTISTCVPALRVIISMWANLVDAILWHFGSDPLGGDGQHMDCVRLSCHSCPSHTHLRSESMPIPTVHEARSRSTVRC